MVKGKRGDNYRNRQRRWHTGHGDGMALDSAMDNSLIFRSVARYTVGQLADLEVGTQGSSFQIAFICSV